jgi:hypothetical protein
MTRSPTRHHKRGDANRPVRRPLVFAIVALALLMMSVDSTIVATALHALWLRCTAGWSTTSFRPSRYGRCRPPAERASRPRRRESSSIVTVSIVTAILAGFR